MEELKPPVLVTDAEFEVVKGPRRWTLNMIVGTAGLVVYLALMGIAVLILIWEVLAGVTVAR